MYEQEAKMSPNKTFLKHLKVKMHYGHTGKIFKKLPRLRFRQPINESLEFGLVNRKKPVPPGRLD